MAAAGGTPCCAGRTGSGSGCWASAVGRSAADAAGDGNLCCTGHHRVGHCDRRIQRVPLRGALRGGNASSSLHSHRRDRRSGADAGRARSRLPVIQMNVLE